jgi:hypothetical protein
MVANTMRCATIVIFGLVTLALNGCDEPPIDLGYDDAGTPAPCTSAPDADATDACALAPDAEGSQQP